jgi:hypothetical protein
LVPISRVPSNICAPNPGADIREFSKNHPEIRFSKKEGVGVAKVYLIEEPTCCEKCKSRKIVHLPSESCFVLFKHKKYDYFTLALPQKPKIGTSITIYNQTLITVINLVSMSFGEYQRYAKINPRSGGSFVYCGPEGWHTA